MNTFLSQSLGIFAALLPAGISGAANSPEKSAPATGVGTLLYSTPQLWGFAYAREKNTKGDRLYKMRHARK